MNRSSRSSRGRPGWSSPCWLGVLGVLLLTAAGCPRSFTRGSSPEAVLRAYAAAIQGSDWSAAYGLMSMQFRKRHDLKDFVRQLRENSTATRNLARQLQARAKQVEMAAKVELDENESWKLVVEKGSWKIATDPLDLYSQRTPEEALRSFVRALERRRYDIVLRFVPSKYSDSMTVEKLRREWEGEKRDEVAVLIKTLKANLKGTIHQSGDTASMPYGDKFEVRFVREEGVWRIEDPD